MTDSSSGNNADMGVDKGGTQEWQYWSWEERAVSSQGSYGGDVQRLQEILIENGYLSGEADGVFGDETRRALTSFQEDNGFEADGILRNDTWAYLNPEEANMDSFIEEYEEDDLTEALAAEAVPAEASGEESQPEGRQNALTFLRDSATDDLIAFGIVDFRGCFDGVQDEFVLVPIHVRDLQVGQKVKAVLSTGAEYEITCLKPETVMVPFPRDASNIGYVIYLL